MRRWQAAVAGVLVLLGAGCEAGPGEPGGSAAAADSASLYERLTDAPGGGRVHLVRMVVGGDTAAFDPAEIRAAPGDVVRFVMAGPQPQTVSFPDAGLPAEAAAFLRERGLTHGELLTAPGQVYDVSFRDAPPGRYPFHSVPHLDRGMRGTVVVE